VVPKGVHLRLAIEGQNIFIYYLFPYISGYHFSRIIICLLLNIFMISHDEIFCHIELLGVHAGA